MTPAIPTRVAAAIDTLSHPVCAYVYDLAALSERIAAVKAALPPQTRLFYAMKANSRPELVARAAQYCDGIEIASPGELATAIAAGARHLIYGGPSKTDAALTAALSCGTPVTVVGTERV